MTEERLPRGKVKEEVLQALLSRKGEFLSGDALALELGCTRTAVWKAMASLREEGHEIEASRRFGYRLLALKPGLSAEGLRYCLGEGDYLAQVFPSVPSTNLLAKAAVGEEAPEGSVFAALSQTRGRGRQGKSFYSPPGAGIYFSVVLRPNCGLERALFLTTAAASAVVKAVEDLYRIGLSIKWVNDLFLRGRKVGGILTEAVTDCEGGLVEAVIVGIGLNLFPPEGGYPPELAGIAGALFEEKKEGLDENALVAAIVRELLAFSKEEQVSGLYRERSLCLGREVLVQGQRGVAREILPDGRLLVALSEGGERIFSHGELCLTEAGIEAEAEEAEEK